MDKKEKRVISKEQLLMLQGLTALRDEAVKQFRYIERTIASLLDEPEEMENYFGHVSDYMWEDFGAKELLKKLGVKVK